MMASVGSLPNICSSDFTSIETFRSMDGSSSMTCPEGKIRDPQSTSHRDLLQSSCNQTPPPPPHQSPLKKLFHAGRPWWDDIGSMLPTSPGGSLPTSPASKRPFHSPPYSVSPACSRFGLFNMSARFTGRRHFKKLDQEEEEDHHPSCKEIFHINCSVDNRCRHLEQYQQEHDLSSLSSDGSRKSSRNGSRKGRDHHHVIPYMVLVPCTHDDNSRLLHGDGPEELRSIQLSVAGMRTLVSDGSLGDRQQVETEHGPITIATVGDSNKPTILTYHDLGLNHVTNFQSFFLYPEMRALLHSFRVVSVNAPGQEEGAQTLPEGYVYPTMDQLAETVERVRQHLGIRTFIGLGVGLGANVLSRYALLYPTQIDALLLINCSGSKAGWLEWGYQKLNIRQLKAGTMTTATVDYLLWHCFGKTDQCAQDLVTVFRQHFEGSLNATNLGLLIDSYIARTDLGIMRELDPHKKKEVRMIRCPILNMTSNFSQHIEDSEAFNGRLDPVTSNYMKVQDCGMVLEEQPGKVVEAFRLFLQGQGYALHSRRLNCRQNSLPLIRDIKHPNPCPELLSSLRNADDDDRATTNGDSAPSDVTHDGGSDAANGDMDGVTVGVMSTNGSDKDIRITENPLEHPAV